MAVSSSFVDFSALNYTMFIQNKRWIWRLYTVMSYSIKIISDWNGPVLSFWAWWSLTLAPGLNFRDSATLLRRCFRGNQVSDRREKYRWLGTIIEISLFQRLPPIADIFHCDPTFSCRESTAEVVSPNLKLSPGAHVEDCRSMVMDWSLINMLLIIIVFLADMMFETFKLTNIARTSYGLTSYGFSYVKSAGNSTDTMVITL